MDAPADVYVRGLAVQVIDANMVVLGNLMVGDCSAILGNIATVDFLEVSVDCVHGYESFRYVCYDFAHFCSLFCQSSEGYPHVLLVRAVTDFTCNKLVDFIYIVGFDFGVVDSPHDVYSRGLIMGGVDNNLVGFGHFMACNLLTVLGRTSTVDFLEVSVDEVDEYKLSLVVCYDFAHFCSPFCFGYVVIVLVVFIVYLN